MSDAMTQPSKDTHYRLKGAGDEIWVYQGIDTYHGEQTYMFRNTANGRLRYQLPMNWQNFFDLYHKAGPLSCKADERGGGCEVCGAHSGLDGLEDALVMAAGLLIEHCPEEQTTIQRLQVLLKSVSASPQPSDRG